MSKTVAIISGNIVTNVIVVDDVQQSAQDLGAVLIEYTSENPAGIGYSYDETTRKFNPPVEVVE